MSRIRIPAKAGTQPYLRVAGPRPGNDELQD